MAGSARPPRPDAPQFYGRRKGHSLSPRQRARLDAVLARYGLDESLALARPETLFPRADDVWLEIGFGAGEHLVQQATDNPHIGLIGCEPYVNGLASLVRLIEEQAVENIRIFPEDARLLLPRLGDGTIGRAFLLFPDPWPKKRHHRRRFVTAGTVAELARVLKDGAELRFATDHMEYCRWALACLHAHPALEWCARRPGDWRERPADWPETRYEAKSRAARRAPVFLRFRRLPRAPAAPAGA